MNELLILGSLFTLVLAGVFAAGYGWLNRDEQRSTRELLVETVALVGQAVPEGQRKVDRTKERLILAGYRQEIAIEVFQGLRAALGAAIGLLAAVAAWLCGLGWDQILLPGICAGGFGFLLPDSLLQARIRRRAQRLRQALPQAVDLIVLALEAGQSLSSSLVETSKELRLAFPDLSAELHLVHLEFMASKSRGEAFRNMAERNIEPEIKRFVQVLIDSERFGTSLAPALRTHVRYLRVRIRQKSREAARKVGVKLVFPVFFLIFPSILVVTLVPAVLQISTTLLPMMTGQP